MGKIVCTWCSPDCFGRNFVSNRCSYSPKLVKIFVVLKVTSSSSSCRILHLEYVIVFICRVSRVSLFCICSKWKPGRVRDVKYHWTCLYLYKIIWTFLILLGPCSRVIETATTCTAVGVPKKHVCSFPPTLHLRCWLSVVDNCFEFSSTPTGMFSMCTSLWKSVMTFSYTCLCYICHPSFQNKAVLVQPFHLERNRYFIRQWGWVRRGM